MKDEDIEMKFKLEMDVITPIPRTITRKFSSLRHMRQWKNRNEIDSCLWCVNCRTYTRNEKGEWEQFTIFGKQIVLKSEMENALRYMAVKGYNQLTPEEWNELNRKLREDKRILKGFIFLKLNPLRFQHLKCSYFYIFTHLYFCISIYLHIYI